MIGILGASWHPKLYMICDQKPCLFAVYVGDFTTQLKNAILRSHEFLGSRNLSQSGFHVMSSVKPNHKLTIASDFSYSRRIRDSDDFYDHFHLHKPGTTNDHSRPQEQRFTKMIHLSTSLLNIPRKKPNKQFISSSFRAEVLIFR